MALAEKLCELEQKEVKLIDEAREMYERCEKENRLPTKDEETRLIAIRGKDDRGTEGGELMEVRQQIGSARNVLAAAKIGHDPRSGQDPATIGRRLSDPLPHEDPGNTRNAKHRFNFMKACKDMMEGGLKGIEAEVSQEICGRRGIGARMNGFVMPQRDRTLSFQDIDNARRADDLATERRLISLEQRVLNTGAGSGAIPVILDKDWIELLRNQMRVMEAGAREITDLHGKFAIPRQNAAATSYWVAESGSPTGSNQALDQVPFTPHTIGAFTDISRRFFELTILASGEEFVKEDLTAIIGRGIDLAAINGAGGSNQPQGIAQNPAITASRTVALGTNGGVPTWSALVEMHTIVQRGNAAGLGEFVYMGNADVEGTLATTAKIGSTFPIYLLDDNGKIYSRRFLATQQVPSNLNKGTVTNSTLSMVIGGIWNQLIIGYWSGVDIIVDPYTGSSSGTLRIVALQDLDVQVRHPEAFSLIADMITNQSQ